MSTEMHKWMGLGGVAPHDNVRAHKWQKKLHWLMIFIAVLTIPAMYLEEFLSNPEMHFIGWMGNLFIFLAFLGELLWMTYISSYRSLYLSRNWLNVVILLCVAASLIGFDGEWVALARLSRLAFVALLFFRMLRSLHTLTPGKTPYLLGLAAVTLALSGAGFYWLEPTVHSYSDGLWLAFTSGATVGYGDIVPTTHASRFFAVIMVVFGIAIMSLVTASIAAFFVGEDEKKLRHEMHQEMRLLREEIITLREELNQRRNGNSND